VGRPGRRFSGLPDIIKKGNDDSRRRHSGKVRQLSPRGQEKVLHYADDLRKPKMEQVSSHRRSREIEWLAQDRHNPAYANQWVVIEGDSVVAAGTDAVEVYDTPRANGIEVPFVVHVVPEDPLPWGGW
jgi:hypothetical protein